MNFWNERKAKKLFQGLPFYTTLNEKPKLTSLKNMDLLQKFPFYDELNIYEMSKTFGWYARSYKVEIVDSKDPLAQQEASKSSIKDWFKELLVEMKGFKYQSETVKSVNNSESFAKKYRICSCLFNSTTKTVINFNDDVDKSFQEALYRTDNWINKGSGWINEAEYVNISVYSPLSGSTYIELPCELKNQRKVSLILKAMAINVFFGIILKI